MSETKIEDHLIEVENVDDSILNSNLAIINNTDLLEKTFVASVIGYTLSQGFTFAPDCLNKIRNLIAKGVENLMSNNEINIIKIIGAEVGLIRIVSKMMAEAKKQNKKKLGVAEFGLIYDFFCPDFYPFC